MATIYLPDDHGDAIIVDGVAYHRVGEVVHEVTHTPTAEDELDISALVLNLDRTYGNPDENWTACQHAVSQFNEYSGDVSYDFQTDQEAAVENPFFIVPENGELYVYDFSTEEYHFLGFFVDGVHVLNLNSDTNNTRAGFVLQGGQTVQYGSYSGEHASSRHYKGSFSFKFRPNVYPV